MTLLEPLAAAVVGVALLWLVAQPMVQASSGTPAPIEPPDPEETPRGQALLALKEIEFDHATGKLSDADFKSLNARYTTAAIEMLGTPDSASTPDALHAGPRCLVHGPCTEAEARFCPACGLGLVMESGNCASCAFPVPADGRYCPGCGVPVRA